jgi:hypothetical protein
MRARVRRHPIEEAADEKRVSRLFRATFGIMFAVLVLLGALLFMY